MKIRSGKSGEDSAGSEVEELCGSQYACAAVQNGNMASRLFRRSLQSILKNNVYLNHSGQTWNHFNAAKTTAAAFVVPTLGLLAWNEWRKRSEASGGALCVAQCTSKAKGDASTSASQVSWSLSPLSDLIVLHFTLHSVYYMR